MSPRNSGLQQLRQLRRSVQAVAAAEGRLFGKLGERQESFGPAGIAEAATGSSHRQSVDDSSRRAMHAGGQLPIPPGQKASYVLAVTAEELVCAHPR